MTTPTEPVLACPHCSHILTVREVRSLFGRMANSLRVRQSGGRNGGRPPKQPTPQQPQQQETTK